MADLSQLDLDGYVRDIKDAKAYRTDDSAETTIADDDYIPFYDTSASAKKKSLWSNIVDKIKTALGISSSGGTYLKKDGTWDTPTDTTYDAMTVSELTTGTATTLRTMRADYAKEGVIDLMAEPLSYGTVETIGSKAIRSYEIGENFIGSDGKWYFAKSAITGGSTTLSSSNCEATSVSDRLWALVKFTQRMYSATITGKNGANVANLQIKQVGRVVCIWGFVSGLSLSSGTAKTIATFTGVGYPTSAVRVLGNVGSNAYSVGYLAYVAIDPSGNITVTPKSAGANLYFNATYLVVG